MTMVPDQMGAESPATFEVQFCGSAQEIENAEKLSKLKMIEQMARGDIIKIPPPILAASLGQLRV